MADESRSNRSPANSSEETPEISQGMWRQAVSFQSTFANVFRYRVGLSDATIVFGEAVQTPFSNIFEDKVSIALSWPTAKALAYVLSQAVDSYENEYGPLPQQENAGFQEDVAENTSRALKAFGAFKASKPSKTKK